MMSEYLTVPPDPDPAAAVKLLNAVTPTLCLLSVEKLSGAPDQSEISFYCVNQSEISINFQTNQRTVFIVSTNHKQVFTLLKSVHLTGHLEQATGQFEVIHLELRSH